MNRPDELARMMSDIMDVWHDPTVDQSLKEAIYALSDGFGIPGVRQNDGEMDKSAIRDSSEEAIMNMWKAIHA